MNLKAAAIMLALVCIVLGGALWYRHSVALESAEKDRTTIHRYSNEWVQATSTLDAQRDVSTKLETEIAHWIGETKTLSNQLVTVEATLARTRADAQAAATTAVMAAENTAAMLKERDERIKELESERASLEEQMASVQESYRKLESSIAETEKKLTASEGDRDFLIAELKRLQTEKADMERKFTDLAALREQVRDLRHEEAIAFRRERIRRGLTSTPLKGAELLMRGFPPIGSDESSAATRGSNFDLNVEMGRDGGVLVGTNRMDVLPGTPE